MDVGSTIIKLWSTLDQANRVMFKPTQSMIGAEKNRSLSLSAARDFRKMATGYQEQADLIYEIGEYNQGILLRAGRIAIYNVFDQTYKAVSTAKAKFMNRGFLMSGSSQMVIDEMVAEGMNAAREAGFNAEAEALSVGVTQTMQTIAAQNAAKSAEQKAKDVAAEGKQDYKTSLTDLIWGYGNVLNQMAQPTNNLVDEIFGKLKSDKKPTSNAKPKA
jgi:hypothetical protein